MKKTLLFLFLTVCALSFNSCSDDDNGGDPATDGKILVSVYYKMENSEYEYPDSQSKIFIIRGVGFTNSNFEYKGEGKFYNKDKGEWTEPVQKLSNEDNVTIEIKCDYDCTVVAESAHIEGKYEVKEKLQKDKDRSVKIVFPAK